MVHFTVEKEKTVSKRQTSSNRRAQSRAPKHQLNNWSMGWQIAEKITHYPGHGLPGIFVENHLECHALKVKVIKSAGCTFAEEVRHGQGS